MRFMPFHIRSTEDKLADDEIDVILLIITHPDEPEPFLISSDNKHRIQSFPEPRFVTRSTWESPDGRQRDFQFLPMGALVPDEGEDASPDTRAVIPNVDDRLIELAISDVRREVKISMAHVMASAPDVPIAVFKGMDLAAADFDPTAITFTIAPDPVADEGDPTDSLTEAWLSANYAL